jgi:hypothetical protein
MAAFALSTARRRVGKAVPVALAAVLAGCSGLGLPFGLPPIDPVTTASIPEEPARGISAVDLASMKEAIRGSLAVVSGGTVFWSNGLTGSGGTIEFAAATDEAAACRPFWATVNDLRGVRRYRSEACPVDGGSWDFAEVRPMDGVLL